MYYSSDPVLDAARHFDALYDAADDYDRAIAYETDRLEKETMAMAKDGDFDRLRDAFDYRDCDEVMFRALVACAEKGDADAVAAMKKLTRTYAEVHAEVKE